MHYRRHQLVSEGKVQKPPERIERSPEYYTTRISQLEENGLPRVEYSGPSYDLMHTVWNRWKEFCNIRKPPQDPLEAIRAIAFADYAIFLEWMIHKYPKIRRSGSVSTYNKQIPAIYTFYTKLVMDQQLQKSINKFLKNTIYPSLNQEVKNKKPSISHYGFIWILYWYWTEFKRFFPSERQRVTLHAVWLYAAYMGQRPVSLTDPGRRFRPERQAFIEELSGKPGKEGGLGDSSEKIASSNLHKPLAQDSSGAKAEDKIDDLSKLWYVEGLSADGSQLEDASLHAILYKDIWLRYIRPRPGVEGQLVMQVRIRYTKNGERKCNWKRFAIFPNKNPLLCAVSVTIALALDDDAFESSSMRNIRNILSVKIPEHKNSLTLRWKKDMENKPVFRQGLRADYDTPLSASTMRAALKSLGSSVGFEENLTPYCIRRGAANAVDGAAGEAVRLQIMDHVKTETFQYYINRDIRCDVQAAFLEEAPKEDLIKALGSIELTADPTAPREISKKQKAALKTHPDIVTLQGKMCDIRKKVKEEFKCSIKDACNVKAAISLVGQHKQFKAELHRTRTKIKRQWTKDRRADHFQNSDTRDINAQFDNTSGLEGSRDEAEHCKQQVHLTGERLQIVNILRASANDLSESDRTILRVAFISNLKKLCRRCEKKGIDIKPTQLKTTASMDSALLSTSQAEVCAQSRSPLSEINSSHVNSLTPYKLEAEQCLWCFHNKEFSEDVRRFRYKHKQSMLDHVEKSHLRQDQVDRMETDDFRCPDPACWTGECQISSLSALKNHISKVHSITLRHRPLKPPTTYTSTL